MQTDIDLPNVIGSAEGLPAGETVPGVAPISLLAPQLGQKLALLANSVLHFVQNMSLPIFNSRFCGCRDHRHSDIRDVRADGAFYNKFDESSEQYRTGHGSPAQQSRLPNKGKSLPDRRRTIERQCLHHQ